MRLLVCGSRDFGARTEARPHGYEHDWERLITTLDAIHEESPVEVLIHGAAVGADTMAGQWAKQRRIPVRAFAADWHRYGKAAGTRRNTLMLEEGRPDLVVAFLCKPLMRSRGTANMVLQAMNRGVQVRISQVKQVFEYEGADDE